MTLFITANLDNELVDDAYGEPEVVDAHQTDMQLQDANPSPVVMLPVFTEAEWEKCYGNLRDEYKTRVLLERHDDPADCHNGDVQQY